MAHPVLRQNAIRARNRFKSQMSFAAGPHNCVSTIEEALARDLNGNTRQQSRRS
jgi:hypothetical protein